MSNEKVKMIKTTTCNNCKMDVKILEKMGKLDKIDVIDENHPHFNKLIEEYDIESAPTYIIGLKTCSLKRYANGKMMFECEDGKNKELKDI